MRPSFPARNVPNNNTNSLSSSPSSSSSSSSSKKPMEDVWKDLNLACLQDRQRTNETHIRNHSSFPCMIFQDFLAKPSGQDQPSTTTDVSCADDFINSVGSRPATMLSLNSGFATQNSHLGTSSFRSPYDVLASSSSSSSSSASPLKRNQENQDNSCDRRHKRMIKNRESAARSRARKQAYTQQLELEANQLRRENDRLKMQQEILLADRVHFAKKNKLYRASTAPF